ncbi:tetratricopeptide repeat protein [Magnetococcus sp. PR-3]|uniref:tetratricopeptide repeat protein n=1 Tax=Magnetococcus sp. PR-3 TaxID=3120355 RepID=UPI002FCE2643
MWLRISLIQLTLLLVLTFSSGTGWAQEQASGSLTPQQQALKARAEQGDHEAQYRWGIMLAEGKGVAQDLKGAYSWFYTSATSGHATAQFHLANMYLTGRGADQDDQAAFDWFMKSARQGHPLSQYNLGLMYFKKRGPDQDLKAPHKWFLRAANQNFPLAQFNLGVMYFQGGEWAPVNYVESFKWLDLAARNGMGEAEKLRTILGRRLSDDELIKTEQVTQSWITRYGDVRGAGRVILADQRQGSHTKITGLLKKAVYNLKKRRFTTPPKNNAYDQFHKVLAVDPRNGAAQEGISRIADGYMDLVDRDIRLKKWKKARKYLNRAKEIIQKGYGDRKRLQRLQDALQS